MNIECLIDERARQSPKQFCPANALLVGNDCGRRESLDRASAPTTKAVQGLAARDPAMLVWWGTEVECPSAIAGLERDSALDESAVRQAWSG